jgi:hypothetical protein
MTTTFVWDILMFCVGPRNMKLIIEEVLFHVKICKYLLDYILPFKLAIVQQEVLVGISKVLEENKQANNGIKFATKRTSNQWH